METFDIVNLSRRDFLKAGAGLTLGIAAPGAFAQAGPGRARGKAVASGTFEPNAFIRIGADNRVTVVVKHLEMGQGTYTGLPTLVAEELDADWRQIRVEAAPADASRYNNLFWGGGNTFNSYNGGPFVFKDNAFHGTGMGGSANYITRSHSGYLGSGQATLGTPPASPTMPRERTNAFLWGHICWQAYHSPRLAKLNTASCVLPYLIVAPPSNGKSSTWPTGTQRVSCCRDASSSSSW